MTQNKKKNLTSVPCLCQDFKEIELILFYICDGGGLDDGIKQRNECVCDVNGQKKNSELN